MQPPEPESENNDPDEWFPDSDPADLAQVYADFPVFAERYRLGHSPGAGAMGRVFRAFDTVACSEVAIKILHDDLRGESSVVESFIAEAALLARCRHPSVVNFRESGTDPATGSLFLVMDYLPWTLRDWIGRAIPWQRAVCWMRQACSAIAHAHRLGIVHRDLKPSNLLVTREMSIKVCDFGAAASMTDSPDTTPGQRGHRVEAALHELRKQVNATPASDIKALGMIFYLLLTGRTPEFASPQPSAIAPVPPACDEICRRAISPEPGQAFVSAGELDAALAVAEDCILRPSPLRRIHRTLFPQNERRRFQTAATLSAAVLIVSGIIYALLSASPPDKTASSPGIVRPSATPSPGLQTLAALPTASTPAEATKDRPFVTEDGHHFLPVPNQPGVLIDATEVRRSQFEKFAATLSPEDSARLLPAIFDLDGTGVSLSTKTWADTCPNADDAAGGLNVPAAEAYCQWLTARERAAGRLPDGAFFRLPWALEWWMASGVDVAALGTDWDHKPPLPWGSGWPVAPNLGNFAGLETAADADRPKWGIVNRLDPFLRVAPAGSFLRGPQGFYDMDGNVAEWVLDPATHGQAGRSARVIPGFSWMSGSDNLGRTYDMGQESSDTAASYRGFRVALQFSAPTEPRLQLILHSLTDTTGSPDSDHAGQPLAVAKAGDRVRVTWQVSNHGAPANGFIVRSNAMTASPHGTVFRAAGVKDRPALGGGYTRTATLATGQSVYLSWDMDTTGWPAEPTSIKISAAIHTSEAADSPCLETSAPGSAIPWVSSQWLLPAFELKKADGPAALAVPAAGLQALAALPTAATPAEATKDRPFTLPGGHYFLPVPDNPGVLLAATEVTRAQFQTYVDTLDSGTARPVLPNIVDFDGTGLSRTTRVWTDNCPQSVDAACGISAITADAYCKWLTETERTAGRISPTATFRLPWASEWLTAQGSAAALRGPSTLVLYSWGDTWPPPLNTGNFAGPETLDDAMRPKGWLTLPRRDPFVRTAPVGSFPPNPLGFYDIEGNVSEWAWEPPTTRGHLPLKSPASTARIILGPDWAWGRDHWKPFALRFDSVSTGQAARGLRLVLEYEPPRHPRFLLVLRSITDTSGQPDSDKPGTASETFTIGDKVRVTWRVENWGAPGTGILRSNAATGGQPDNPAIMTTLFRGPGVEGRDALGGGILRPVTFDTGKGAFFSFDMHTTAWSPGRIRVSSYIHDTPAPDARLIESSTNGAGIGRLGLDWWIAAFDLKAR